MKSILLSRVFWFNILTGIIGILAIPELVAILPPEVLRYVAIINPVGNVILRRLTSTPVTFTGTGDGAK